MSTIHVEAQRTVDARPEDVYKVLADYQGQHKNILPPDNYVNYHVEQGGEGSGTVFGYQLHAGNRVRPYTLRVSEPTTGRVIQENDTGSSLVTTWTLTPEAGGSKTDVRLTTEWTGGHGVGGFFERTFAPGAMRKIYGQVLDRLSQTVS